MIFAAAAVTAFAALAEEQAEFADSRVRSIVPPKKVVATSQGLGEAERLCGTCFGQVSEGAFWRGRVRC